MDDFNKTSKYDLRETRFSQNYDLSIDMIDNEFFEYQSLSQRNEIKSSSPFKIKKNSSVQHDQSFAYGDDKIDIQKKILGNLQQSWEAKIIKFTKFTNSISYFDDQLITRQSYQNIDDTTQTQKQINPQIKYTQQNKSDNSDQDDVFSQKISLIRQLQHKLFSLQERMKISTISTNTFYNQCKVNIQRQYEDFLFSTANIEKETSIAYQLNQSSGNQLSEISQTHSQFKNVQKKESNEFFESESMLLDKDYSNYERYISTKNICLQRSLQPTVQFVQTIRIIQVPYLIEVNRDIDEKIESKKSFYFEENEDIHKTFEEFTKKQSFNQNIFQVQQKIKPSNIHESGNIDFQYNSNNILHIPMHSNKEDLSLSIDQSNRTFHNHFKEKRSDISYDYNEKSQIISKLLTKYNPNQIEELQDKIKFLEIENLQLKEEIKEHINETNGLDSENEILSSELHKLAQFTQICLQKLNNSEQKLQSFKQQFLKVLQIEQLKIKQHYQKQIQQYESQQSEYANRIIAFEQLFQQQRDKQINSNELIEEQLQQLQHLKKICKEKQFQVQIQVNKRRQTEGMVIQREKQLKDIIQSLQKDNSVLKSFIIQIQKRYESEGFYILSEEAEQLKNTIQLKDQIHIQELQKIENRYTSIIAKYQVEIETMKSGLKKVRMNKSNSISQTQKSSNNLFRMMNQTQSKVQKRQSILKTQIKDFCLSSSKNSFPAQTKQVNNLNSNKMKHVGSIDNSQIDGPQNKSQQNKQKHNDACGNEIFNPKTSSTEFEKLQGLVASQIEYLRQQNSKIKIHLSIQKQQKRVLSQKLMQLSQALNKQIIQANQSDYELQRNEQVFHECVQQLQKQYLLNKKLKQQLKKAKQMIQNQVINIDSQTNITHFSEYIKEHPFYLELNKNYIKSKKYIKILQKQLLELTLIPQFNQQNNRNY